LPTYSLPDRPSVEQLKKQAEGLLRAARAGTPAALRLFAEFHPNPHGNEYSLDSAQLVTARMYGFANWPRLRRNVERRTGRSERIDNELLSATVR
jgi:hypothetical protein